MKQKKPAFLKPLLWAYGAIGTFTVISIVGPIILDRIWNRKQHGRQRAHPNTK